MNYKQANSVKELTPKVNKVLEGLEIKCKCLESEHNLSEPDCILCKNTGKIPYSWTPQVGEWCIDKYKITRLIIDVLKDKLIVEPSISPVLNCKEVTPILEWETIEEVLEKAGYELHIQKWRGGVKCQIFKIGEFFIAPLAVILKKNITVQEVVMEAVIELRKCLK